MNTELKVQKVSYIVLKKINVSICTTVSGQSQIYTIDSLNKTFMLMGC